MKIYQIHEYGGEWEDYYDRIVTSYLLKEKAIVEKERLEKREAELMKCSSCPLYYCPQDCKLDCLKEKECREQAVRLTKKYCDDFKPYNDDDDKRIQCENRYFKYDESSFRIEEVEVIE